MRIKYYLRGLGIGIVVTALLMGFAKGGQKETLTDAEIVERAKSLGMIESSVLSADLGNKQDLSVNDISGMNQQEETQKTESEAEKDNPEITEPGVETDSSETTEPEKEIETENPEKTKSNTETEKTEQTEPEKETEVLKETEPAESNEITTEKRYVVTIYSGEGSGVVANRLEEMGVIEDAAEFDQYLCQNGYDKRLTTGNHEINAGADKKEIAEALVKRVN